MMSNKDYYKYRIEKGHDVYFQPYKLDKVEPPFTFLAISALKDCGLPDIEVNVEEKEELLYKKRVFGKFSKDSHEIVNIFYFVGKRSSDGKYRFVLIDIKRKQFKQYEGEDYEEIFQNYLKQLEEP